MSETPADDRVLAASFIAKILAQAEEDRHEYSGTGISSLKKTAPTVVTSRNANAQDERLKEVMEVITRKLHEAVKEIEPTQEEWFEAILFLTETGHMCNDWRQEFILLSDVLGVSMLVDAINSRRPTGASETRFSAPSIRGRAGIPMGANICLDQKGEADAGPRTHPRYRGQADRGRARSMSGRPMTRASTTSSKRAFSPTSTCGACSHRARTALLVPRREAEILPDPRRRPGGQAAGQARAPSLPAGASALHRRSRRATTR
jgi:hypothetical protein